MQWQPKGNWNKKFSARRKEPLSQYWRYVTKGKTFSVFCPQMPGSWIGCGSWVDLDNLPRHLWVNHSTSLPQLLAGRGCAGCNITVPLASLPLHLDCMSQNDPTDLPTHANSPSYLKKSTISQAKPKPGNESPTQYWTCKPSGTFALISCPAPRCNNWIKVRFLSDHLQKMHGKSMEQLLAGRGCYRCDKIVPVSRLLHHLRCMNQRPQAKQHQPSTISKKLHKTLSNNKSSFGETV